MESYKGAYSGTQIDEALARASGIPKGGTPGQVLMKKSLQDYDAKWETPSGGGGGGEGGGVPADNPVFTGSISMGRKEGTTVEDNSTALGSEVEASGYASHAEGFMTIASGIESHAEGKSTVASGTCAHAEGNSTTASGSDSHSEGNSAKATGDYSHAEGASTEASEMSSHAEGTNTVASGKISHAEGFKSTASGERSHAEGNLTTAKGYVSHAAGDHTVANDYQYVVGTYNVEKTGDFSTGDRFIVGGGTNSANKNAFRVNKSGACYGSGEWNSGGADYAELFEWADGNPDDEDRAGLFVTLDGKKIRLASPEDDYILGVVSACPSVVGDVYDDQWKGMEVRDVFGRIAKAMQDVPARTIEVSGKTVEISPATRALLPVINPDYDPETKYIPRTERPEWDAVGLLGKLVAVDDGTCEENGWATVGEGGTATASELRTKYRVMERLDETHVQLMIL